MSKRTLGDRINRGFVLIVIVLGGIMAIRFAIAVTKYDVERIEWRPEEEGLGHDSDNFTLYPETQDDVAETANALEIPIEWVDSALLEMMEDSGSGAYIRAYLPLDSITLRKLVEHYVR
jgi:hypothetical protein